MRTHTVQPLISLTVGKKLRVIPLILEKFLG